MKKSVKIAGAAALALALTGFTSCGGKSSKPVAANTASDSSDVIPKETVTLQVFDQLANFSGEQVGWFGDVMLEKFNVKLNIIPGTESTYTTRMESGNLGDIVIWGNDSDDYLAAANGGLLFDWDEENLLAEYGPYIKQHMPKALEKNRGITESGKLYGFGFDVSTSSKDRQNFFYTWDLRFDLYEQLGKPEIKDYDDLVDVLKRMKEICPADDNGQETYGVSLFPDWDGNMVMFVKSLATAYVGWDEFGFGHYDAKTGKYHSCLEKDGPYIDALRFFNKLYRNNLLDPDSQTQNYDSFAENYSNGTAFWNIFNWMASGTYNTDAHKAEGKAMYPVLPKKATPICYGQNVYGGNRVWSIGAKTEYPELCMAIINWLSTPEGFMTTLYGPKGVTWDYDANKKTYLTDLGKLTSTDPNQEMPAPYSGKYKDGSFQMNNTTWAKDASNPDSDGETYNKDNWASNSLPAQNELEQHWRDWAKATSVEAYLGSKPYALQPSSTYSEAQRSDELQATANQCAAEIKSGTWKAMYAKSEAEFDKLVDEMITKVTGFGISSIDEFYTKEAARKKAAEDAAKVD